MTGLLTLYTNTPSNVPDEVSGKGSLLQATMYCGMVEILENHPSSLAPIVWTMMDLGVRIPMFKLPQLLNKSSTNMNPTSTPPLLFYGASSGNNYNSTALIHWPSS